MNRIHIQKAEILFSLVVILALFNFSQQFKCERDGLFEDEADCKMYYECLWIGTQFERVEHIKCADSLIYNPEKHRCDEISEFEQQFSNGVETPDQLIQFIRFRNCLAQQNNDQYSTTATPILITENETLSPQDASAVVVEDDNLDKPANETETKIEIIEENPLASFSNETILNNTIDNLKSSNETKPTFVVNIKASKMAMNITSTDQNATSVLFDNDAEQEPQPDVKHVKNLDETIVNDDNDAENMTTEENKNMVSGIPNEDSVYVMEDEKVYFGKKVYLESQANKQNKSISSRNMPVETESTEQQKNEFNKKPSDLARHLSVMKIFIRRRVLKTSTLSNHNNSNEEIHIYLNKDTNMQSNTPTTEAMTTSLAKRDTNATSSDDNDDEFIRRAKHRPLKHLPINNLFKKRRILSIDENEETTENVENTEAETSTTTTNAITTTETITTTPIITSQPKITSFVDSVEQRLTRSGKVVDNSLTKQRIQQINSNLLSANLNKSSNPPIITEVSTTLKLDLDDNSRPNDKNLTFLKFLRVNHINDSYFNQTMMIGRKPLKFVKMLKKPNLTTAKDNIDQNAEQKAYRTINPVFVKPTQPKYVTFFPKKSAKKVEINEFDSLVDTNKAHKSNQTSKKMRVFHLKPLQYNTTFTTSIPTAPQTDATTSMPQRKYHYLYKNLKGRLSNITKKNLESFVIERNNITRISELEKGGPFQRMFLQPADALIECKDNDFGLECSCSITLSPPKCKQLINSFLSSCRIVGCQNNGRCINMAYRYPIPYVCSCPSTHMGSYCEITRDLYNDMDIKSRKPAPMPLPLPQPKVASNEFKEPICQPSPCLNHGVCEIVAETVKCNCVNSSYTGQFCETFIPTVAPPKPKSNGLLPKEILHQWNCPSDCNRDKNQGRCVLSVLGYPKCVCEMGWIGVDCSQKNYCLYNDCLNNATCSNLPLVKSYICLCSKGFSGRRCEVMATNTFQQQQVVPYNYPGNNPCGSVTCLNDGTCLMSFSREKNQFSFICKCKPGYRGLLCETKIDCDTRPCSLMEDPFLKSRNASTKMSNSTSEIVENITTTVKNEEKARIAELLNTASNPCRNDNDLCNKYPYGNDSFVCIRSLKSHDYTLCLPTSSVSCNDSPCLNGGTCTTRKINNDTMSIWKCQCTEHYTGNLCETELCTDEHKTISNHTMCLPNSANFITGGLEPIDIELVLDMHNSLRRQVMPSASNMQKMYWDLRLQQLAQKRAQLCNIEADNVAMRQLPGYGIVIGENFAAGYDSWAHVLSSWIGESKYFTYDATNLSENMKAIHYTQMIYSGASRIGCGYAECSGAAFDRYFVCYYAEMQTYQSHSQPYVSGNTCSKCPNHCNEGLCDCKGVYCSNGGTLDLNSCKCNCPSNFDGDHCEKINCTKEDAPFCGQTLFQDKCWLHPVIRANCPYMCRLCKPQGNTTLTTTKPTTRISDLISL